MSNRRFPAPCLPCTNPSRVLPFTRYGQPILAVLPCLPLPPFPHLLKSLCKRDTARRMSIPSRGILSVYRCIYKSLGQALQSTAAPGEMALMSENLWDEVLARVEGKINRHSFATWFRPTSYVSSDEQNAARLRPQRAVPRLAQQELPGRAAGGPLRDRPARHPRPLRGDARRPRTRQRPRRPRRRLPSGRAPSSTRSTRSRASSSAPRTSSRMPPPAPSPRSRRSPTTRSSSTAAWASARRTSCTRSGTTSSPGRSGRTSSTSRPTASSTR